MLSRRKFQTGVALGSLAISAKAATPPPEFKPYIQVKTLPGDERVVRVWYTPSCTFSKEYIGFFKNLGATLPESKKLIYSPVVNKGDGYAYPLAFSAVALKFPELVQNFVEASLIGVQERGLSVLTWQGINKIGDAAGLPQKLTQVLESNIASARVNVLNLIQAQALMKITNTPSVAVAGTYIVTPEFTNGDQEQFSKLVNALVSMTQ
jgi:hypothetical protein